MGNPCGKFGDCSFSRFDSIMRTDTQTHRHTRTERRLWTLYFRDSRRRNNRLTIESAWWLKMRSRCYHGNLTSQSLARNIYIVMPTCFVVNWILAFCNNKTFSLAEYRALFTPWPIKYVLPCFDYRLFQALLVKKRGHIATMETWLLNL